MRNLLNLKMHQPPLTDEEKTQLIHKKVRLVRKNPEALDDLPIELFLRLVGIYFTIPIEVRENDKNAWASSEFLSLRKFIDVQLATEDGKNFAKYEMGDYVHNLYLLLIVIVEIDYLEANIHNIREEYRGHAGEVNYKLYTLSKSYEFLSKYQIAQPTDQAALDIKPIYEEKLRVDYGNLVNEIRRSKLFEQHIEDTRSFLMEKVFKVFILLVIIPILVICFYILRYDGISKEIKSPLFIGFTGLVLVFSSAIAGATGSLTSVLLRIQGVRDNNQLAQNLIAFKYSKASLQMAPFTGMVFAILLSFILLGGFISGTMFPSQSSWSVILFNNADLSKLLVWSFIAGFSERLVPDMVDRLADKAKKADDK